MLGGTFEGWRRSHQKEKKSCLLPYGPVREEERGRETFFPIAATPSFPSPPFFFRLSLNRISDGGEISFQGRGGVQEESKTAKILLCRFSKIFVPLRVGWLLAFGGKIQAQKG